MSQQSNFSPDSDGFVFVTSSKKQRKTKHFAKRFEKPKTIISRTIERDAVDVEKFLRCFDETQFHLKSSNYFKQTIDKVRTVLIPGKVERIICLGLGRFLECPISRYQLAFIRCLQEVIHFDRPIQYFDPVFGKQEVETLEHLNGFVLRENCEGKYSADVTTLFYLPHCPKQISNNLLWKNWSLRSLERLFLIGNSFSGIIRNSPNRLLEKNAHFILEVEDSCREIEFENSFNHTDIFNDTSLHYFDVSNLRSKPEEFWISDEPCYTEEDLELITRNIQLGLTITAADNGYN